MRGWESADMPWAFWNNHEVVFLEFLRFRRNGILEYGYFIARCSFLCVVEIFLVFAYSGHNNSCLLELGLRSSIPC